MPDLREYLFEDGRSPFASWFASLDARAAAKVAAAQVRVSAGLTSRLEPVGNEVFEQKIDYGPGYRVYLAYDGPTLIILLGGGDKSTQSQDIADAKRLWAEYKRRKSAERKARAPNARPAPRDKR